MIDQSQIIFRRKYRLRTFHCMYLACMSATTDYAMLSKQGCLLDYWPEPG